MHPRPGLAGEQTGLELGGAGRGHGRANLLELGDGLFVAVRLDERLGAGQRRLDAAALVGRDAVRQKPASTPRRLASHVIVSPVGRVLPRSIWLTYSFENRSPASSLCVRPAAMRSWRRRSPSRRAAGRAACATDVGGVDRFKWRLLPLHSQAHASPFRKDLAGQIPRKGGIYGEPGSSSQMQNHLTELLDFPSDRLYCESTLQGWPYARLFLLGARQMWRREGPEALAGPQSQQPPGCRLSSA